MSNKDMYDEDYFIRGKQSGKSLYENYRWIPELTIPMVQTMIKHLGINPKDTVLDFGCARGYMVRAFRECGYKAFGYDISDWAVNSADEFTRPYLTSNWNFHEFFDPIASVDWIIAKDVLEHVQYVNFCIKDLLDMTRKGMLAVVPLSRFNNGGYVIKEYEMDVTHCQRFSLSSWMEMFLSPEWSVTGQYRLPGIKDNWYKEGWERGNGFITVRRLE